MAAYVEKGVNTAMWRHRGTVRVHLSEAECGPGCPPPSWTSSRSTTATCLVRLGGDDLVGMAAWVGFLGVDFEVLDPPELAEPY